MLCADCSKEEVARLPECFKAQWVKLEAMQLQFDGLEIGQKATLDRQDDLDEQIERLAQKMDMKVDSMQRLLDGAETRGKAVLAEVWKIDDAEAQWEKVNQKMDGLVELCKKLAVTSEREVVCV